MGAFWRACKFLEQPVVVMLFIDEVISLFELDRVDLLYPIHLSQDAFLEALAFLGVFLHLSLAFLDILVEFAHLLVAEDLLIDELRVLLILLDNVDIERVQSLTLELSQIPLADRTRASSDLLCLIEFGQQILRLLAFLRL